MTVVDINNLQNGLKVVRGPNWKWRNQDLNAEYGTISIYPDTTYTKYDWVDVIWTRKDGTTSSVYSYRIGGDGHEYDLCVYDDSQFKTLDGKQRTAL